jgi:hypothetical protein
MIKNPINLLPIKDPIDNIPSDKDDYFYENVVKYLISDIVKLEANGIPIDLDKVSELEDVVVNVLDNVRDKLKNNKLMLEFLTLKHNEITKVKVSEYENRKLLYSDLVKPFNVKNKIHRTYVVNWYLELNNKSNMIQKEWSVKDLKVLYNITGSNFINNLLNKIIENFMLPIIEMGMIKLASDQADIYNKNKIDTKIEKLQNNNLINEFNPNSPLQKRQFFDFCGIESETETKKGNDKFDRLELERIQKLLEIMIEDKNNGN